MRHSFRSLPPPARLACGVLLSLLPALAPAQNKELGAKIAAQGNGKGAVACVTCHGAKGEGNLAGGFPRLAGLGQAYIAEQLTHYADGQRQNPIMAPMAKQLAPAERQALGAYYAFLKGAPGVAAPAPEKLKTGDAGSWLALRGRWEDGLPACVQCHGPGGIGAGAAFPALVGQSSAYLAAQLHAFKQGTRPGGPQDLMAVVAKKLSDADITAVADYFSAPAAAPASSTGSQGGKK